jgi:hypothetical protein
MKSLLRERLLQQYRQLAGLQTEMRYWWQEWKEVQKAIEMHCAAALLR